MKILIFDDEEIILSKVEENVSNYFDKKHNYKKINVVSVSCGNELQRLLDKEKFDIYFFDICSGEDEMFGIRAAKKAREVNKDAHIIFLTAFEQYLEVVIEELIRPSGYIYKDDMERRIPKVLESIIFDEYNNSDYLSVSKQYVKIDDILYIYYNGQFKRSEIHFIKGGFISTSKPLKRLIESHESYFLMINRNVAACKQNIKRANTNYLKRSVTFADGRDFEPSRAGIKNLKDFFDN